MGATIHVMFGPVTNSLADEFAASPSDARTASALMRVLVELDALEGLEISDDGRTAQTTWHGGSIAAVGRAGLTRVLQRSRMGYEISEWPDTPTRDEPIGRQVSWRPGMSRELTRLSDMTEGLTITESLYRHLMREINPEGLLGDYFLTQITPLEIGAALSPGGLHRYGRLIAALGDIGRAWR